MTIPSPNNVLPSDIAFTVPDLDAKVRLYIKSADTQEMVSCVEATLSNGKTVYQAGVAWVTAIIAGLGLIASAFTSGLGHSNTAAHIAANAMSFFSYMQSQAIFGMVAVGMPPIVESWTQNFQWSMGIIRLGFMQTIATWYQRATGGTPSRILQNLATQSVEALKLRKRDASALLGQTSNSLLKRDAGSESSTSHVVVRGIERVGFRAKIESTNIFLTGVMFLVVFVALVMIVVCAFKVVCELMARSGQLRGDKFQDFRNDWKVVMRGILFRVALVAFPQMTILCMWEFTKRDSPAEIVLAVMLFVTVIFSLGWASTKVMVLARRSVSMHSNPAYILYSDPTSLNKWGFLYVHYRATAYYFILPLLAYIFVKGMFVGLSQKAPEVQTIAYIIMEAAMLITVSVLRPWMDKKTNAYNITIIAINFLNAIFLLFYSGIFGQPQIVSGVMGVVFFIINAILSLLLLVLVLVASIYAVVSKNPDTRYQPMRDDRSSFMKSQGQFTTELDALGATARNDMKSPYQRSNVCDEEESSFSSGNGMNVNPAGDNAPAHAPSHRPPASPVDNSLPLFPSENAPRRVPSPGFNDPYSRTSPVPRGTAQPWGMSSFATPAYRAENNTSPWQRGAGYERF